VQKKNKIYRPNVAAVIMSSKYPEKCEIFIARRNDFPDAWQFPQGGIDIGETPRQALLRELKEEIGTNNIEIISKFPDWITYDFPALISEKMYPFDGQRQQYYLVRLKSHSGLNIQVKNPEFSEFKFVDINSIFDYISYFKKPIYRRVLSHFRKEGYLLC
jgi:putative (di)nucleoside polyphosphate hydrolase